MNIAEIYNKLDEQIHFEDQMSWDNSGLLIGRTEKEVESILVALDLTDSVAEQAVQGGYDLVVTHHPMIWDPIKRVTSDDPVGRRVLALASHDIGYIACHTCFDAAHGGMGDICGDMLGIEGPPMLVTGERDGSPIGIGRSGTLAVRMNARELAKEVRDTFALDYVTVYGERLIEEGTVRAAICPGSGKREYRTAIETGAEVLITGDITHHEALDAAAAGICIIDAGHYGLEKVFMKNMAQRLAVICGDKVQTDYTYEGYEGIVI